MTIAYREYIINISYEYPTAANGFRAYSRNRNESRQYRWQLNPWFKLDGAAGLEPATSLLQSVPAEDEFARLTKSDGSGTRHWSARYGHTTRNANTPHLGRYLWECDRLEPLIDRNQADADLVCNTQGYLRDVEAKTWAIPPTRRLRQSTAGSGTNTLTSPWCLRSVGVGTPRHRNVPSTPQSSRRGQTATLRTR